MIMDFFTLFIIALFTLIFTFLAVIAFLRITSTPIALIKEYTSESKFSDGKGARHPFPSIDDPATVTISVVVPAYNEEERLPAMLDECLEYLESRQISDRPTFKYEVIIVDDGSKDKTSQVALQYSSKYGSDKVRVLTLEKNRGKGGAVRLGVFRARGKFILFADADGATKFADLQKLEDSINKFVEDPEDDLAMVVGSRAHLEQDSIAQRSIFRTILMYGFHFLVWLFCIQGIRDTQCGFKLLTRRSARICFKNLHVERWAFDVELLYIAQRLGMKIDEVAVNWTEIPGSKVTPLVAAVQMGRDLVLIWLRYRINAWVIDQSHDKRN